MRVAGGAQVQLVAPLCVEIDHAVTLTVAVLKVAEHCAQGTSDTGDAVVAVGYVLSVDRTVTRVAIDTSLSKWSNILSTWGPKSTRANYTGEKGVERGGNQELTRCGAYLNAPAMRNS